MKMHQTTGSGSLLVEDCDERRHTVRAANLLADVSSSEGLHVAQVQDKMSVDVCEFIE